MGWAAAKIGDDTSEADLTASDIGDALGDLLLAVWLLLQGDEETRCSWWEEPGEYRWIFRREGPRASLRILEFAEAFGGEPDSAGHLVFETSQPVGTLAAAIVDGASRTLETIGEDGYAAKWGDGAFPIETLDLIKGHQS